MMLVVDFRDILKRNKVTAAVRTSLFPDSDPVEVKCTKTALRDALKGSDGEDKVLAFFRAEDSTLVLDQSGNEDAGDGPVTSPILDQYVSQDGQDGQDGQDDGLCADPE